jgi:hypothetical protein
VPQIEKQQFRNNTQGWIGAVSIGPRGDESGVAIAPGETVWLSEAEQVLTANAPRSPEDNPFLEQTHIVINPETGAREEIKVTPLSAVSEDRFVPANARPIPADLAAANGPAISQQAATADEPSVPTTLEAGAFKRHAEVTAMGAEAAPGDVAPAASDAEVAAATAAAATEAASQVEAAPPADQEPSVPEPTPPPAPAAATPPGADPTVTVPPDEGRVSEETAAQSPGPQSEETGAAAQPQGDAVAGSFTPGEEVGTPDAPATPAPWTPGG